MILWDSLGFFGILWDSLGFLRSGNVAEGHSITESQMLGMLGDFRGFFEILKALLWILPKWALDSRSFCCDIPNSSRDSQEILKRFSEILDDFLSGGCHRLQAEMLEIPEMLEIAEIEESNPMPPIS